MKCLRVSVACIGRILGEVYKAIRQEVMITKRDIYYHDPSLFKTQETVDRYVDDIAHTCQVRRRDLNVVSSATRWYFANKELMISEQVASPKGLVAGLATSPIDQQTPIMQTICDRTPLPNTAHIGWILAIEKEVRDGCRALTLC